MGCITYFSSCQVSNGVDDFILRLVLSPALPIHATAAGAFSSFGQDFGFVAGTQTEAANGGNAGYRPKANEWHHVSTMIIAASLG